MVVHSSWRHSQRLSGPGVLASRLPWQERPTQEAAPTSFDAFSAPPPAPDERMTAAGGAEGSGHPWAAANARAAPVRVGQASRRIDFMAAFSSPNAYRDIPDSGPQPGSSGRGPHLDGTSACRP